MLNQKKQQALLEDFGLEMRRSKPCIDLDSASLSEPSPAVKKAMADYRRSAFNKTYTGVCEKLKRILNAGDHSVRLTSGAMHAFEFSLLKLVEVKGKKVIVSDVEFDGMLDTLEEAGASLIQVKFGDAVAFISALDDAIQREKPAAIFISHIARFGEELPVKEISSLAHKYGLPVIVDGAQAIGRVGIDLAELNPDIYLISGHKALHGPEGTGALLVSNALLSTSGVKLQHRETYSGPNLAGLSVALDELENRKSETICRVSVLHSFLATSLRELEGVKVFDECTGIISFALDGVSAGALHDALENEFGILCTAEAGMLRVSLYSQNTAEDVNALLSALNAIVRRRDAGPKIQLAPR